MVRVLIIGGGDTGLQIAGGLLQQGQIAELTVADRDATRCADRLDMLSCCFDALVRFQEVDGLDLRSIERLLREVKADLIIQCASLISPWDIIGREHPTAQALSKAGIAIQLPAQLTIVRNLMQAVRELNLEVPVANLSMPDIIHPILKTRGFAPTIGLGNVSILHLRARAAFKERMAKASSAPDMPLLRVIGHHKQVYEVMQAKMPEDETRRVRVHVGEAGERDDRLAYSGKFFPPGPIYNVIASMSALPVARALLPNSKAVRFSAPGPQGLPGGYPVRIATGDVSLDLPKDVELSDAIEFNQRMGELDGLGRIEAGGFVLFSDSAQAAVRDIDPELAEPLDPWSTGSRTEKFLELMRKLA